MNTNKEARWKGAGMGAYYCSLCCEVGDIRSLRCPNCNARMYTNEEYNEKAKEWEAEDNWYNFWNEEVGPPPNLKEILNKKCEFCERYDFANSKIEIDQYGARIVLSLCNTKFPKEEQFQYCPMCGRKLTEE